MPDFRKKFFDKNKKTKEQVVKISYMEKIKSHRFMIFYRSLLVTMLVVAVIAAFFFQWRSKIYTDNIVISSISTPISQGSEIRPFNGCLLVYGKDGAGCMDAKGNALWNETFEMQNPMIDMCQNVVAFGDFNGRTIYVMNTSGMMGSITTNKPVRDFCVASNGVVAAVVDDADVTLIYLYDCNGNELVKFRTTMKESGYPVDVSISPSGELVCVSYLFVDSGQMKSSVAFYNFGKVGQNSTDNYVSGYDYLNTVVPFTHFLGNGASFAAADDRIAFFGGNQKPVSVAENLISEEIQGVYYGTENVGLVFRSTDMQHKYKLDIYSKSGQLQNSLGLDIDFLDIVFYEDQIIIYNEAECCIYNKKGVQKYSGRFKKAIKTLVPLGNNYKYLIVTGDSIDTIELK